MLARLLNACHHFPGFVYAAVRLIEATSTIEVDVRPRRGSKPHCSCCGNTAPGYDVLAVRRFEFIPIWGYAVMLLYAMRRVQCRHCGVKVEQVPWAIGKHSLTKAYMLYLAHWARKLSWKETALSFGTTWDQVCHAVEYVVQWGLEHRELGTLRAIGVDEIHIGQSHKFLTLGGAAGIATPRTVVADGAYFELSAMTGLRSFVASFAGHIAAEAAS